MHGQAALPDLADQFRRFAVWVGRDGAPLYQRICEGVAEDRDLLGLLTSAPPEQRRPNLLLAAVHYLLLRGADSPLVALYDTVAEWRQAERDGTPGRRADPFPAFRDLCHGSRGDLEMLLATRATQTNEVGRCSALLPALATVASAHGRPLSLVDFGASAGLHLRFDRYAYAYTSPAPPAAGASTGEVRRRAGDPASPVLLEAELRSGTLPDTASPAVARRVGIDQRPVDPRNEDEALWLLACQWPDHIERFRRLSGALALARDDTEQSLVVAGDAVTDLPGAVASVPTDSHLCILHTWTAAYLPPERQARLAAAITAVGDDRPVSWLFAESPYEVPGLPVPAAPAGQRVKGATALVLVELSPGRFEATRLADMHPHGRWLHWWGPM